MNPQDILFFWFEELDDTLKFQGGTKVDQLISQRFKGTLDQVKAGEHAEWRETLKGRLAEIIVLDQFSRHIYRGSGDAFAQDDMALALAQEAIRTYDVSRLTSFERNFLYMPFMHSESLLIHEQAGQLFRSDPNLSEAFKIWKEHRDIIEQFGRYPYRNKQLGRTNTPEEDIWLKHNDSF